MRLGSVIQKLITIPAALQKCRNPVPRVAHPDWLRRRIEVKDDRMKQKKMTDMFMRQEGPAPVPQGDMEDFGKTVVPNRPIIGTSRRLGKRKGRPGAEEQEDDPYASLPGEMPSMTDDYVAWLQYQKKKWSIQKHARERRRQLFGDQQVTTNAGLGKHFRDKAQKLFVKDWQVLQLKASEVPGEVKAWVLIENQIQMLKIKVPRTLFLNMKDIKGLDDDIEGVTAEDVTNVCTLPNGHRSVNLYRLTMPEEVYVAESKNLMHMFSHPSVEGVYETQVPPTIRAVLDLGSICTVDDSQKGALGKGLEGAFDMSSLKRTQIKTPYLHQSPIEYIFVYHVVAGDRQIFGFFSTAKDEAYVVVYNAKDATLPNMDKLYAEQLLARKTKEPDGAWQKIFQYQDKIHFNITTPSTKKRLQKEVADILKNLREENRPVMVVVQSPKRQYLLDNVPALADFPILPLKSDPSDSNLPPLGWQSFVAKRIVTPESYVDFIELVVPELQKRGSYKTAYETGTLREKVFNAGARLPQQHTGSTYRH